jgi:16S rRNA (cytosine967-C5)-methyltransferase
VPDYAVVDMAVKQVRKSKKQWAASMVNGVLRNVIRQTIPEIPPKDKQAFYAHPLWMIERLQRDWPETWQSILAANNQQAPMTLRINKQRTNVTDYQMLLEKDGIQSEAVSSISEALILDKAYDVTQLPGYDNGWFSVQDAGAQLAAQLLQPQAGDRILDACAAPGGKTAHLFELNPDIKVTALDISEERLKRVSENVKRLGFSPEVRVADASDPQSWWDEEYYDKILLDVPCSATGVIRRHPDIKHLRVEQDIQQLQETQQRILQANWPLLKPGGILLYATCSVFKAENEQQIERFLKQVKDAEIVASHLQKDQSSHSLGLQLFPTVYSNDGFYYALLRKTP